MLWLLCTRWEGSNQLLGGFVEPWSQVNIPHWRSPQHQRYPFLPNQGLRMEKPGSHCRLGSQGKPFGEIPWNMICPGSLASPREAWGPSQSGLAGGGHLWEEMFSIWHSSASSGAAHCQHAKSSTLGQSGWWLIWSIRSGLSLKVNWVKASGFNE